MIAPATSARSSAPASRSSRRREAMRLIEERGALGKVVLDVGSSD